MLRDGSATSCIDGWDGRLGLGGDRSADWPGRIARLPVRDVTAAAYGDAHTACVTQGRRLYTSGRDVHAGCRGRSGAVGVGVRAGGADMTGMEAAVVVPVRPARLASDFVSSLVCGSGHALAVLTKYAPPD